MAKGRKRAAGQREANGRLKRPTVAQLKEIEAARYRENMRQVAAQPHRRSAPDPLDPRLENALGRFCVRLKLRPELYDAGQEWASIVRRWRAAKGCPEPMLRGPQGSGLGPSEATVAAWTRLVVEVERELSAHGQAVWFAARQVCIDDNDLALDQDEAGVLGLIEVAKALGRIARNAHPFSQAA